MLPKNVRPQVVPFNKGKTTQEIVNDAIDSAEWSILSGASEIWWDEVIIEANRAGSVAKELMKYDEKFGELLKDVFGQMTNALIVARGG